MPSSSATRSASTRRRTCSDRLERADAASRRMSGRGIRHLAEATRSSASRRGRASAARGRGRRRARRPAPRATAPIADDVAAELRGDELGSGQVELERQRRARGVDDDRRRPRRAMPDRITRARVEQAAEDARDDAEQPARRASTTRARRGRRLAREREHTPCRRAAAGRSRPARRPARPRRTATASRAHRRSGAEAPRTLDADDMIEGDHLGDAAVRTAQQVAVDDDARAEALAREQRDEVAHADRAPRRRPRRPPRATRRSRRGRAAPTRRTARRGPDSCAARSRRDAAARRPRSRPARERPTQRARTSSRVRPAAAQRGVDGRRRGGAPLVGGVVLRGRGRCARGRGSRRAGRRPRSGCGPARRRRRRRPPRPRAVRIAGRAGPCW